MRDAAGKRVTSSGNYDLSASLTLLENLQALSNIVYQHTSITKVSESEYSIEIVALKRGSYSLTVTLLPGTSSISGTPLTIYWDSHLPSAPNSSASGDVLRGATSTLGQIEYFSL